MKNLKLAGLATLISTIVILKGFAQSGETPHQYLADKAGKWSVVITLKLGANEPEQVVKGITAERSLVGDHCIHELMQPAGNLKMPDFKRLADLAWNLNEQR